MSESSSPTPETHADPKRAARLAAVRRAIDRLRRGAIVAVGSGDARIAVAALEVLDDAALAALRAAGDGALDLAMTPPRAGALGLEATPPAFRATLRGDATCADLVALAEPLGGDPARVLVPGASGNAPPPLTAALALAKLAELLPMVIAAADPAGRIDEAPLDPADIHAFAVDAAHWLVRIAETRLPLADAEDTRLIAFRPWTGGPEHLAIVIGQPDVASPVLTRIHSACFTGDLIGSLRCDCGDQLRGAIRAIAAQGAGVVVYLPQEGRGIGLVNKVRAYALQDAGFDTIDANTQLGFEPDERSYAVAGEILRRLGITRIRLLTNNPGKRAAMGGLGVEVVDRVPLVIAANPHNEAYLRTKKLRDGHSF